MAFLKILSIVLASILGFSHCAYVDTLNKCELSNKQCHKKLIETVLHDIAKTGIEDLKIPPIDPIVLKHINATIGNVIDFELIEGTAKGISNCVIDNSDVDIDHLRCSIQLTCDLTIKGTYNLKSSSGLIREFLKSDIHGKGNGKVKLEKITIKIEFPFEVKKRGDDTFLTSDIKKYKYTYKVQRVVFWADNLYLGDKESSKEIVNIMNENWKPIMEAFGTHFLDIAMKIIYDFVIKFFYYVPTTKYLIDDLSSYA